MRKYKSRLILALLALLVVSVVATLLTRPQPRAYTFVRLADTDHREVRFHNAQQDIDLAGLLFLPDRDDRAPGAVIIHGSGTSQRDNGWYLTLVRYLQDHGVAVLLPDKRGSEQSGGDWRTAGFDDLATDTAAAVDWLSHQAFVDPGKIGVIGMSQGGQIAPLVANQLPDLAFVVSVVGASIPAHQLLVYEENYNLREFGVPPGLSNVLAYPAAWSLIHIRQKSFWDAVGDFDPAPYWKRIAQKSLALYGESDTNVPSARSAAVLRSLGNPNIEVRIYPDSGHALEAPIGVGTSIFRKDALEDIVDFIRRATGDG